MTLHQKKEEEVNRDQEGDKQCPTPELEDEQRHTISQKRVWS